MRDALSLTDQVLSFAGKRITPDDVRRVLGLIGDELYLEMFEIIADRRHGDVFRFVDRVYDEGYDLAEFQRGLADAIRTMMIVKLDGADKTDVPEHLRTQFTDIANRFATGDLLRMLSQVAELDTEGRLRKSANPRIMLEALLLRFAHLSNTLELEQMLSGSGMPPAGAPASRPPASAPTRTPPSKPAEPPRQPREETRAGPVATDVTSAWRDLLDSRTGIPQGMSIFLKAAQISEPQAGSVVIDVPKGLAFEKLSSDATARVAIQKALTEKLGREVRLEVRAEGSDAAAPATSPKRFTPEQVKSDKLARMAREEPVLGKAVEEWNLELME
jgi:DNA polymerase III gamma/tau subunit